MRVKSLIAVLFFIPTLVLAQIPKQQPSFGRVTGIVLNKDGQLMDHATVCTGTTSKDSTRIDCDCSTDGDGRFQIEQLKIGTYSVFAVKEDEGYTMENQSPGQTITITNEQPLAVVTLRMSPNGGILTFSVKDKTTGKPIPEVRITYQAVDATSSGSGRHPSNFRLTLPTATDLIVVLSAKGYKSWFYTDPSDSSRPVVRLEPGEERVVDVELTPLPRE
jgi:Carboxypeptidase regulatory-like domain